MNKNICIFTQTYGNDRKTLFDYHNHDHMDIEFRNSFQMNLYSFHNSDESYINELLSYTYLSNINNLKTLRYNNISYTETWRQSLIKIEEMGADYVIFMQDDCFNISNKKTIEGFIRFIKNEDFDMLSLECPFEELNTDSKEIIYTDNELNIFKTTSDDFVNRGYFSFDDAPYVAKIDFIKEHIYDENYYSCGDIWGAEAYLNNKIRQNKILRYTSNNPIYRRFNIIGRNAWNKEHEISRLKKILHNDRTTTN